MRRLELQVAALLAQSQQLAEAAVLLRCGLCRTELFLQVRYLPAQLLVLLL